MRAIVRDRDGAPEVLRVARLPQPEPGPSDVLVRVAYAGLNRADCLERAGRYGRPAAAATDAASDASVASPAAPAAPIAGIEFAGTVERIGQSVTRLAPGDRVCGIVSAGAHAEFVAIHALSVARVPAGLSLRDAAAVPEAYLTAYDALFTRGAFGFGDVVLVHAIGSGAGLAAASLANRAGGVVLGTSRTPEKLERARAYGMGAGFAVDDGFLAAVAAATHGHGVDLVLDFVGGPGLTNDLRALRTGGRIVQIGTLAGARAELDLGLLMGKRATIVGTVLRTRELDEKIVLARVLEDRILPSVARGELRSAIDRVFPLEEIARAHDAMEAGENFGKIVIAVGAEP